MRFVVHGYLFAVLLTVAWGGAAVADELKIPGGCVAADSAKPGPAGYADRVIHDLGAGNARVARCGLARSARGSGRIVVGARDY